MKNSSKPLIYLASASPRRTALLTQVAVAHEVHAVAVDESVLPGEQPARYVQRLAALKAETLWRNLRQPEHIAILGADTAVAVDGEILGKPADERDCLRMLALLSGRTHQVFTAVALRWQNGNESRLSVSEVTFRRLGSDEIRAYWRTGEPADKAGAYAIQGLAALFVERVAGSYSGIMGLPLFETAELLALTGWRLTALDRGESDGRALREARG
jgi:septum formation protein